MTEVGPKLEAMPVIAVLTFMAPQGGCAVLVGRGESK